MIWRFIRHIGNCYFKIVDALKLHQKLCKRIDFPALFSKLINILCFFLNEIKIFIYIKHCVRNMDHPSPTKQNTSVELITSTTTIDTSNDQKRRRYNGVYLLNCVDIEF